MIRGLGFCVAGVAWALITINALFMAISPQAWFRLPPWLKKTGALTEDLHVAGWGAIKVRLGGAIILAGMVWLAVRFVQDAARYGLK